MTDDTERVEIWSIDPPMKLYDGWALEIGINGLPTCRCRAALQYRPWAFPANWQLRPLPGHEPGELLIAWRAIQQVMSDLALWQQRHEQSVIEEIEEKEKREP